jgi:hypothetical protein
VPSFVCAHLTAHAANLAARISDYRHIVGSLLFPPLPCSSSGTPTTIYSTSHLFFFGDLNFRLALPPTSPYAGPSNLQHLEATLDTQSGREELREFDQLLQERKKCTVFQGLREFDFWGFKCSYKFRIGEVDKYRFVLPLQRAVRVLIRDPFPCIDLADRECQLGLTGFCTQPTLIRQIPRIAPASPICCILLSHHTLLQIMCVEILQLSFLEKEIDLSPRNLSSHSYSFRLRPRLHHRITPSRCFPFLLTSPRDQIPLPRSRGIPGVCLTGSSVSSGG